MQNVGEEICGEYLKHIKDCEFISYNVPTQDVQGEIDVIGINLNSKLVYVCEVAVHVQGLQYVTNKRPDDYHRFMAKFEKDIDYAKKHFADYTIVPMLWSPIVKINSNRARYNTIAELERLKIDINTRFNLELNLVINEQFNEALELLKDFVKKKKSEFKSNVMRLLQIESSLETHLNGLAKRGFCNS